MSCLLMYCCEISFRKTRAGCSTCFSSYSSFFCNSRGSTICSFYLYVPFPGFCFLLPFFSSFRRISDNRHPVVYNMTTEWFPFDINDDKSHLKTRTDLKYLTQFGVGALLRTSGPKGNKTPLPESVRNLTSIGMCWMSFLWGFIGV